MLFGVKSSTMAKCLEMVAKQQVLVAKCPEMVAKRPEIVAKCLMLNFPVMSPATILTV